MEFTINRNIILKSLGHAYGVIEKKTTLPILSNILVEAKESKVKITATDLDIIYSEEIPLQDLKKEGTTTTSASVLYDILRKLESDKKVEFFLQDSNKLKLISICFDHFLIFFLMVDAQVPICCWYACWDILGYPGISRDIWGISWDVRIS